MLLNVLDYDMDLYEAVEEPRVHHQLMPNRVGLEPRFSQELAEALESRHHEVSITVLFYDIGMHKNLHIYF